MTTQPPDILTQNTHACMHTPPPQKMWLLSCLGFLWPHVWKSSVGTERKTEQNGEKNENQAVKETYEMNIKKSAIIIITKIQQRWLEIKHRPSAQQDHGSESTSSSEAHAVNHSLYTWKTYRTPDLLRSSMLISTQRELNAYKNTREQMCSRIKRAGNNAADPYKVSTFLHLLKQMSIQSFPQLSDPNWLPASSGVKSGQHEQNVHFIWKTCILKPIKL